MNAKEPTSDDAEDGEESQDIRTLSEAKIWLANLGRQGATEVQIKELYREVGGGLLVVTASLVREDGARVNVEVYCYDDRAPVPAAVDLFPLPPADVLPGAN